MQRWPRGYVGVGHETIGGSLLSLLQICPFPQFVLGPEHTQRLELVNPESWYPIAWLLELLEKLAGFAGEEGLTHLGRRRFELSHQTRVARNSARDVIYGMDEMYRFANRGTDIGGWTVHEFKPERAVLEKTTPHHCAMERGILTAALEAVKCGAAIAQNQCFRRGADSCVFVISCDARDSNWWGVG